MIQNQGSESWVDSRLVRRLQRRLTRPGLIDRRKTEVLNRRRAAMVAGAPLTERLLRRWGADTEPEAETPPIVYVQPQPPISVADGDAPDREPVRAAESTAAGSATRVVQLRATDAPGAMEPLPAVETPSTMPDTSVSAAPERTSRVVRTEVVYPASAPAIPVSDDSLPPLSVPLPLAPVSAADGDSSEYRPVPPGVKPADVELEVCAAAARQPGKQAEPRGSASPDSASASPLRRLGASPREHAAPSTLLLPVVREHSAAPPSSHPFGELPLANAFPAIGRQPTGSAGRADGIAPGNGDRTPSDAMTGTPLPGPASSAAGANPSPGTGPAGSGIDVDKMVDKVHRQFLRRLAIEGERRGAGKWR